DRASHCEAREATIGGANPLDIDAGRNGGIRVRGWDRGDVLVRSIIHTTADTDADARRIASAVRVDTTGSSVRAEGPSTSGDEHWSVSFELQVPRTAMLTLTTQNGGISIADFRGTAKFTARNGGVTLNNVGGDLRGETTNGGVTIDLRGDHWDGAGLDVETHNGGIRMTMPANYSAQLETGTTNGRINIDFPITAQGSLGRQLTTILGAGVDLIGQGVDLRGQRLNLRLGAPIHLEIELATEPILRVLPVLAHHDDRRLKRREHREKQIQQDEWIGIPRGSAEREVDRR